MAVIQYEELRLKMMLFERKSFGWLKKEKEIKPYYVRSELSVVRTPEGRILLELCDGVIAEVLKQTV